MVLSDTKSNKAGICKLSTRLNFVAWLCFFVSVSVFVFSFSYCFVFDVGESRISEWKKKKKALLQ